MLWQLTPAHALRIPLTSWQPIRDDVDVAKTVYVGHRSSAGFGLVWPYAMCRL